MMDPSSGGGGESEADVLHHLRQQQVDPLASSTLAHVQYVQDCSGNILRLEEASMSSSGMGPYLSVPVVASEDHATPVVVLASAPAAETRAIPNRVPVGPEQMHSAAVTAQHVVQAVPTDLAGQTSASAVAVPSLSLPCGTSEEKETTASAATSGTEAEGGLGRIQEGVGREGQKQRAPTHYPSDSWLTPEGRYQCQHCPNTFRTLKETELHIIREDSERLRCSYCDSKFRRVYDLLRHRVSHFKKLGSQDLAKFLLRKDDSCVLCNEHVPHSGHDKPVVCQGHFDKAHRFQYDPEYGRVKCTVCDKEFHENYIRVHCQKKHGGRGEGSSAGVSGSSGAAGLSVPSGSGSSGSRSSGSFGAALLASSISHPGRKEKKSRKSSSHASCSHPEASSRSQSKSASSKTPSSSSSSSLPMQEATDEVDYVVSGVLAKEFDDDGRVHYLLEWQGYEDLTWTPADMCECDELINEFETILQDIEESPSSSSSSSSSSAGDVALSSSSSQRGDQSMPEGESVKKRKKREKSSSSNEGDNAKKMREERKAAEEEVERLRQLLDAKQEEADALRGDVRALTGERNRLKEEMEQRKKEDNEAPSWLPYGKHHGLTLASVEAVQKGGKVFTTQSSTRVESWKCSQGRRCRHGLKHAVSSLPSTWRKCGKANKKNSNIHQ